MYPGSRKHQDVSPEALAARKREKALRIQNALDAYRLYVDVPTFSEDPNVLKAEEQKFRAEFRDDVENFQNRDPKYNRKVLEEVQDPQLKGIIDGVNNLATRAINAGASNVRPIFTLDYVNNLQEAPVKPQEHVS